MYNHTDCIGYRILPSRRRVSEHWHPKPGRSRNPTYGILIVFVLVYILKCGSLSNCCLKLVTVYADFVFSPRLFHNSAALLLKVLCLVAVLLYLIKSAVGLSVKYYKMFIENK